MISGHRPLPGGCANEYRPQVNNTATPHDVVLLRFNQIRPERERPRLSSQRTTRDRLPNGHASGVTGAKLDRQACPRSRGISNLRGRYAPYLHLSGDLPRSRIPFANELGDCPIGFGQSLLIRQEHDAEVLGAGLLAEAGAVDDHDVLLADQFLHEDFITVRNLDPGK